MKGVKSQNAKTAILIVDMIADFEFNDGKELFANALPAARKIAELKRRADEANVPVIYVNDNYHKWKDDFNATVRSAESFRLGNQIVKTIRPETADYYILKAQRSGFFDPPLNVLLENLGVSELIITGVTTDICVLFTCHDAYMRGFSVRVPVDCTAAVDVNDHETAIKLLSRIADADVSESDKIKFARETGASIDVFNFPSQAG